MTTAFSNKRLARIAGLIYLGVVLTGIFSLMYVPSKIIVSNNPPLTYQNIASSESLFRLWILCGLLCYTFFLFLPLVLYKLLKPVNENYAKLMVLLAIMGVPIFFLNVQNQFNVLSLVSNINNPLGFSVAKFNRRLCYILTNMTMVCGLFTYFQGFGYFHSDI